MRHGLYNLQLKLQMMYALEIVNVAVIFVYILGSGTINFVRKLDSGTIMFIRNLASGTMFARNS